MDGNFLCEWIVAGRGSGTYVRIDLTFRAFGLSAECEGHTIVDVFFSVKIDRTLSIFVFGRVGAVSFFELTSVLLCGIQGTLKIIAHRLGYARSAYVFSSWINQI